MRYALIDTSAIFAIANRRDRQHAAALTVARKWLAGHHEFVLLDWVFVEAMTLLKSRLGSDPAVQTGRELRRNPLYRWIEVDVDAEREIWATFQKYADKEWSYTDCALLVMAQRLKVLRVFAYDVHFDQMPGLRRVK